MGHLLQATVVDDPAKCTYLVTDSVRRTVKFLAGLGVCEAVVSSAWADACKERGEVCGREGGGCGGGAVPSGMMDAY
jgi:hypothetical protein